MEPTVASSPDKIIEDLGGCGRFQIRLGIIVHATKGLICFSVMSMILISATPQWWCVSDVTTSNMTSCMESKNSPLYCYEKKCFVNGTKCTRFVFEGRARTVVTEFELLCGLDYIPSMVMSMQTFGMLTGALLAGQLSDLFGRKPPYFAGLSILLVFNLIGFFSANWIMFAISRLFIGIGCGMFLAIQYCIVSEFSLARWRAWVTGFPSFAIFSCIFALCAWLIQDWRYIQLFCCLLAIPCLLTWFIVPESFRWYIARDRIDDASKVIARVAMVNKRPLPDISNLNLNKQPKVNEKKEKKYTFIHMFKSTELAKTTVLLSINWFALGLVFYGISFGIQALAGNIYLNLFIFSAVAIPGKVINVYLTNKFGRRISSMICFTGVVIGGIAAGVAQAVDTSHRDTLTNVFAIVASMTINMAWGPVQTTTIEVYPTVIRNIGFGSLSVIARFGAVLGPQFVYLNTFVPGLLFFVCGGIAVLCIVSQLFLPETRDSYLDDKIHQQEIEIVRDEEKNDSDIKFSHL